MARRRLLLAILVACGWSLCGGQARSQELEQIRQAVHTPTPRAPRTEPPRTIGGGDPYDPNDDVAGEIVGGLVMATVAAPYYLPHRWFDESDSDRFASYSEQRNEIPFKSSEWFHDSQDFVSSARAQVDYGTNFADIESVAAKLQVDLAALRLTFDGSVTNYFETLPTGDDDVLTLGDANLVVRFAQNAFTVWRSGIGLNWLADHGSDVGFNFTYGVDVLPSEPFVFSTEIDLGTLGHSLLFRSRSTLGVLWRDLELYTGFEYLDIKPVDVPTMLCGVRYWW